MKRFLKLLRLAPLYIFAVLVVLLLRLIRRVFLLRLGGLQSTRIGHFAANTELYLCERDAGFNKPEQRHVDLFYAENPICNQQMLKMWKRSISIGPTWILARVNRANLLIPGGAAHEIGSSIQSDRDIHNLFDGSPPHLAFAGKEEARGEASLRAMGIPSGAPFVCLIARDSAYLDSHIPDDWSSHDYRDSDIQKYVLAAEELANRGYFVIRMGAKVRKAIDSRHKMVIDYATDGSRTDFMDIYLSGKCAFCLSGNTGLDAVSVIFRRPVAYINFVPLGWAPTFRKNDLLIPKHNFLEREERELTLSEVFGYGVGAKLSPNFEAKGVRLIENTPEEIRDVAVEMVERISGTWSPEPDDDALQRRFREIYSAYSKDLYQHRPLHGEIRTRIGAKFLRANRGFLN